MKTYSSIPFIHPFRSIVRQLPKLIPGLMLLALVLMPATSALASVSFVPDNHGVFEVYKFEDLNGDGVWQQPGEPPLANWTFDVYMLVSGQYVLLTSGVTDGTGLVTFSGLAQGKYKVVEQMQIEYINTTPMEQASDSNNDTVTFYFGNMLRDVDFGDLPNNYNMTTRAQNGARHETGAIYLGAGVDTESDGTPTSNASGDNLVGADEDGVQTVASPPDYWTQGQGTVQVVVTGGTGCLFAWMDFWDSNLNTPGTDGDFTDSGTGWSEEIFSNLELTAGTHVLSFPLPLGAAKYPVWTRFRLAPSFQGDCTYYDTNPVTTHGFIEGGEVEDHYFSFTPNAVSLASFTAQSSGVNRSLISLVAILLTAAGLLLGRRMLVVRQQLKN